MNRQLDRRHVFGGEGSQLVDLVRDPQTGAGMVPIGMWDDDVLVAAVALQSAAPRDGWTIEERQKPSLLVSLAHAHPGYRRLGRLLTPWICDYAARQPDPPQWIRCTVREPTVAWYLHRHCAWRNVREVKCPGKRTLHLLQRAPEKTETLRSLIRSEGVGDLCVNEATEDAAVAADPVDSNRTRS